MQTATYWIERLGLLAHPEGGYYGPMYRSEEQIPATALPARYGGGRKLGSSIYFLVTETGFSAFHRLKTDEIWHFYTGSPLHLHLIHPGGRHETQALGPAFDAGERFQFVVRAGAWFAAEVTNPGAYALLGCTLAPGFEFADFELAQQALLAAQYPQHAALIRRLTRG